MQDLIQALAARGLRLAVAETDTGGLLLAQLTAVPGSSAVLLGGVVPYVDALKTSLLGIPQDLLHTSGAVSAAAAQAMAEGVRRATGADIGVATTGIAGPSGATPTKPVGLAYIALAASDHLRVSEHRWPYADREQNRAASVAAAVDLLWQHLHSIQEVEQVC